MTEQIWWHFCGLLYFLNSLTIYFSILLGRCALLSFLILAFVIMLRKTVLKRTFFLKGFIWGIFLIVPFMGKLNLFYDNRWMCNLFMWWDDVCMLYWPIRYGYMLGMFFYTGVMIHKRRKLLGMLQVMKKDYICGQEIFIGDMAATPFAAGLFHSKIVIPKVILENFQLEELEIILLHEKIHILLGHLWCYFLGDVIRILLWPNFFLTSGMSEFRADMEDICDKVTIQQSGKTAYEYGKILLKSIKTLRTEIFGSVTAFVGEKDYRAIRQRMMKIAEHTAYKKGWIYVLCICSLVGLVELFYIIEENSLPRYREECDMVLMDSDGKTIILEDSEILRKAVSANGETVYIVREYLDFILQKYRIQETEFSILFGGYEKLPGFGGWGSLVDVDYGGQEKILEIPYENSDRNLFVMIFKVI